MGKTSMKSRGSLRKAAEPFLRIVFLISACVCVLCVILICGFLFVNAIPTLGEVGVFKFLFGAKWKPSNDIYGIAPMIVGSLYVTAGALVVGVPIGVLTAVYLARFCPKRLHKLLSAAVALMAGIPSVVYGFFGLMVIVPAMQSMFGTGKNIMTASLLLGIMILPTIITVSESSLRAVPESYYEGALALGATKERGVFFAQLPAAKSGIMTSIVLGLGRAVGETMAVVMVAGNQAILPDSLISGVRTMTANIVLEMGYAAGLHRETLIATAAVLFVFILVINLLLSLFKGRKKA